MTEPAPNTTSPAPAAPAAPAALAPASLALPAPVDAAAPDAPRASFIRRAWVGLVFLSHYGAARLLAFIAPLALVRAMDPDAYGAFEFALSAGILAATLLQLGAPTAITRGHIVDGREQPHFALAAAALLASLGGAAAAWWCWSTQAPAHWLLAALVVPLFAAQLSLSAFARMTARRNLSPWMDNLALLALALVGAALWGLWRAPTVTELLWAALGFSALSSVGALVVLARLRRLAQLKAIGQAFWRGPSLLAMSLVGLAFMMGQRSVSGLILPLEALVGYSLATRVSMILAVAYQVVSIGFYRNMFAMEIRRFDRLFAAFLALLTVGAVGLGLLFQQWGPQLFPGVAPLDPGLFGWAAGQILAMLLLGMGQMLVTRYETAGAATLVGLGAALIGGAVGAGLWWTQTLTPTSLTALFTLATALAAVGHLWTLRRRQQRAPWLTASMALCVVPPVAEWALMYLVAAT